MRMGLFRYFLVLVLRAFAALCALDADLRVGDVPRVVILPAHVENVFACAQLVKDDDFAFFTIQRDDALLGAPNRCEAHGGGVGLQSVTVAEAYDECVWLRVVEFRSGGAHDSLWLGVENYASLLLGYWPHKHTVVVIVRVIRVCRPSPAFGECPYVDFPRAKSLLEESVDFAIARAT